ncbi:MAG TPA: TadE/TadG family type IV pilus assembly protein [Reyranellaceae bacterium]|nr:TadE/TadG family type IV pilus assembly protein [Reyranellaceae bacterium]
MMRSLIQVARDERGGSMIEMALVAPFLATLVIGMVDISRGYSEKLQLEQVAQRAVEKAMQGMQGDNSTTIFQSLKVEAATAAGVPQSAVEVRYWLECNGVSQNSSAATMDADYNQVCQSGQVYARYLNVRIQKTYTPMFSTRWAGANANGTYTLVGQAGLRVQ